MGKKWDYDVPSVEIWQEVLRVLKPGGYLLSFAGTRTQHRMAVRIEDAGFEIRDMIAWVYGSGFPKSLNIGKQINKMDGVEFEAKPAEGVGFMNNDTEDGYHPTINQLVQKGESSERAKQWEGWGTALKPALEPITVARKPLEGTVAENCLKWGVGGINIDGCRVDYNGETPNLGGRGKHTRGEGYGFKALGEELEANTQGRFPANLIHDGSDEVVSLFPNTKGELHNKQSSGNSMFLPDNEGSKRGYSIKDTGSAARFFYCAKASKSERNKGCEELEERIGENGNKWTDQDYRRGDIIPNTTRKNFHPTVKPIALMEYLVKLVTKPNHIVIDPFTGSGSTLIACKNLGRNYIGIERESEYCKIAETRLAAVKPLPVLF